MNWKHLLALLLAAVLGALGTHIVWSQHAERQHYELISQLTGESVTGVRAALERSGIGPHGRLRVVESHRYSWQSVPGGKLTSRMNLTPSRFQQGSKEGSIWCVVGELDIEARGSYDKAVVAKDGHYTTLVYSDGRWRPSIIGYPGKQRAQRVLEILSDPDRIGLGSIRTGHFLRVGDREFALDIEDENIGPQPPWTAQLTDAAKYEGPGTKRENSS